MSDDTQIATTPETQATTKHGKGGLLFAVGMIVALVLLVALNMG